MPYGYASKPKKVAKVKRTTSTAEIKTVKGVSVAKLNKRQRQTMKRHAAHHTKQHIKHMRDAMLQGSTFTAAHKAAMAAVGK